jgi:hypothetical protein
MNRSASNSLFATGRLALLVGALVLGGTLTCSSAATPTLPTTKQAFDAATSAVSRGDLAGAEQAILGAIAQTPGSVAYDIEAARRLTQFALVLRTHSNAQFSAFAAEDALARLTGNATRLATMSTADRARAYEVIGFIQERALDDRAAAKTAYLAAQKANPKSQAAARGLARVAADEAVVGRVTGTKG